MLCFQEINSIELESSYSYSLLNGGNHWSLLSTWDHCYTGPVCSWIMNSIAYWGIADELKPI